MTEQGKEQPTPELPPINLEDRRGIVAAFLKVTDYLSATRDRISEEIVDGQFPEKFTARSSRVGTGYMKITISTVLGKGANGPILLEASYTPDGEVPLEVSQQAAQSRLNMRPPEIAQ